MVGYHVVLMEEMSRTKRSSMKYYQENMTAKTHEVFGAFTSGPLVISYSQQSHAMMLDYNHVRRMPSTGDLWMGRGRRRSGSAKRRQRYNSQDRRIDTSRVYDTEVKPHVRVHNAETIRQDSSTSRSNNEHANLPF